CTSFQLRITKVKQTTTSGIDGTVVVASLFVLIVIMVLTGALIHPISLEFIGNQFQYEDKIFTSDAIFVPRFPEDRNGELYVEAFRDYSAGNGKLILCGR
ncbi:MAG: hypothetical protein MZU91_10590, partial [Desulfosudis oleivorans]|nr:hypothetical protein [Desulfosudis oleivorans]